MLAANWFYERDAGAPDNEIEASFRKDEAEYGNAMRFIESVCSNAWAISSEGTGEGAVYVQRTSTSCRGTFSEHLTTLKRFAALCYVRVPAAMKLEKNELASNPDSAHVADEFTSPHRFVSLARESTLLERFSGSSAQLWIAVDADFVASDLHASMLIRP